MLHTELRMQARAILNASECVSPASVYDALSARVASLAGFRLGLLSGSISSASTLAAPDVAVITLTEFADQIRRVVRAGNLSLMVDADNGYGNALNVMVLQGHQPIARRTSISTGVARPPISRDASHRLKRWRA